MKLVFADSFYFIALHNADDAANRRAADFTKDFTGQYVATSAVLTELADALAGPSSRLVVGQFIEVLPANRAMRIVMVDKELFQAGLGLYLGRPDKAWSLTDCISFVVMAQEGVTEALTGDRHFEQAGFVALLK